MWTLVEEGLRQAFRRHPGVSSRIAGLEREVDLRYAAVLYRDLGDAYVTKAHPFSADLDAFGEALQAVEANGGRLLLEKRSELDPGAEFIVSLPLAGAPERSAGPGKPAPYPPSMAPRKPGTSGSRSSVVA